MSIIRSETPPRQVESAPSHDQIVEWLKLFAVEDGDLEIRAFPKSSNCTLSGRFDADKLDTAVDEVARIARSGAVAFYVLLNPAIRITDATIVAKKNKIGVVKSGEAIGDGQVLRRRWMFIDFDAKRESKTSASEAEKRAAWEKLRKVAMYLAAIGFTDPVVCDSGNGYHLLYRVDLPANSGLVKGCIDALSRQFSDANVKIDVVVANAARVTKFYGSLTCKGENTAERPWRWSAVLEIPENLQPVPVEKLEELAATGRSPDAKKKAAKKKAEAKPDAVGGAEVEAEVDGCEELVERVPGADWLPLDDRMRRTIHNFVRQHVPVSVSGNYGSKKLINVLCVLLGDYGLKLDEYREFFDPWNARCTNLKGNPDPWSEREINHAVRNALKRIDDDQYGKRRKPKRKDADPSLAVVNTILERFEHPEHPCIAYYHGDFWVWANGQWSTFDDMQQLATRTYRQVLGDDEPVTRNGVANATNELAAVTSVPSHVRQPAWLGGDGPFPVTEILATPTQLIHLPSLLAGSPDAIRPATPRFFSTATLGCVYDPDAPKPVRWHAFLKSVWGHDQPSIDTLQEMVGMLLTCEKKYEKMFVVIGPLRSGKGTINVVLKGLVGDANYSVADLGDFAHQFGMESLVSRRLIVFPDARLSGKTDQCPIVTKLLSMSSKDEINVHRKFKGSVSTKPQARLVLFTNETPNFRDASQALARRMIYLRMVESFEGREDKELQDALLQELPGILNWAVEGYRRLTQRGHFVQPESGESLRREAEDLASPVAAFVRDRCIVKEGEECKKDALYRAFQIWCEEEGREHPHTAAVFGRDLRACCPKVEDDRVRVGGGKKEYLYKGISLLPLPEADDCRDSRDLRRSPTVDQANYAW